MTGGTGNRVVQGKIFVVKEHPSKCGSIIRNLVGPRRIDLSDDIRSGQIAWQHYIGIIERRSRKV